MPGPTRNYSKELERLLQTLPEQGTTPTLLLHACCAPCSSAVLEYLSQYFAITLLYYNPNIAPYEEYQKREAELRRLVSEMDFVHPVALLPCGYEGQAFVEAARGLEQEPEGGKRCEACFRLRLQIRRAGKRPRLPLDYSPPPQHLPAEKRPAFKPAGRGAGGRSTGCATCPRILKRKMVISVR